ncbi:MAG TPA: PDZ domain-containing protein [Gemmatimonadaceae bacterium]|nr:PDZ domain-containing protein [Gemmatimonadaceae bacterium]
MNATRRAGMIRLRQGGALLALAALSPAAAMAQGAGGSRVSAVAPRADTTRQTDIVIYRQVTPRIDSLSRRLNELPLGSPEYLATEDSLRTALLAIPRSTRFLGQGGTLTIQMAPSRALYATAIDVVPKGWFGFVADGINRNWSEPAGSFVEYFEYPTVVSVESNSPGAKAGVRFGDSLVAFNGLDLRRNPINLTRLLTPGREIAVKLRREGEAKDLVIVVEKAPEDLMAERRASAVAGSMASMAPRAPLMIDPQDRRLVEERAAGMASAGTKTRVVPGTKTVRAGGGLSGMATPVAVPSMSGVYGAAMADVDADLAASIAGLKGRRGVFIERVPPGSLAERIGLRRGDVILMVDSHEVPNTAHLRVRLQMADNTGAGRIRLQVLRGGKTRDLMIEPPR